MRKRKSAKIKLAQNNLSKAILAMSGGFLLLFCLISFTSASARNWIQSSWIGGISTSTANYSDNNADYNNYSAKDSTIDTSGTITTSGLVAYYDFENDTDDNIGENHGIASGSPTYTTGISGEALSLDGNNDYVEIADSDELDLADSFTISAWVKKNESDRKQTLLDKGAYKLGIGADDRVFFEANDGSETFNSVGDLVGEFRIHELVIYRGDLYGGTGGNSGVFRYDGGTTWTNIGYPGRDAGGDRIGALIVYDDRLYAGVGNSGDGNVYLYEGGTTWTLISDMTNNVSSMAVLNGYLYISEGVWQGNIYRYEGGTAWTDLGDLDDGNYPRTLLVYDNNLYCGSSEEGHIFRYDGGTTWTSIGQAGLTGNILALGIYNNTMYALDADSASVFRYDGGTTWTNVGTPGPTSDGSEFVTYGGKLYYGSDGYVFRYDGGTTWTDLNFPAGFTHSMTTYNGKVFIGTWITAYTMGNGVGMHSDYTVDDNFSEISVVSNGSTLSLYQDGALMSTTSISFTIATNTLDLLIGNSYGLSEASDNSSTGEENFRGQLDEIRIYNRALSSEEILSNYKAVKYEENSIFLTTTSTSITHTSNSDFSGTNSSTTVSNGSIGLEYVGGIADETPYQFPATSTVIYRSSGSNSNNELASGTASFTFSVNASGNATFTGGSLPDNVGVGDVVVYDDDDDDDIDENDAILFVHGRVDNQTYTLATEAGSSTIASTTTNNDTWAVYRAYTSLFSAEAGMTSDFVPVSFDGWISGRDITASTGANEIWNIACYADGADSIAVYISSWTTSENNYIRIFTPYLENEVGISQRHNGKWDDSKYRLEVTSGSDVYAINTRNNFVKVDGLQVKAVSTGVNYVSGIGSNFSSVSGASLWVSNNIVWGVLSNNDYSNGILRHDWAYSDTEYKMYVWNNIVYGFYYAPGNINQGGIFSDVGTLYAYNNTIVNNDRGLNRVDSPIVISKNNLSFNNLDDYSGAFSSSTNNAYSEGTDPGSDGLDISAYASTTIFVDPANNDYRIKTDSPVLDQGANLSSDDYISFDYDNQRETRPVGSAWDIGADEYAGYRASGIYVSDAIALGNFSISEADWTTTIATGTSLKFRTDNSSDMSGASDWNDCYEYWNGYDLSNSSCVTDADSYIQYRIGLSTDNQFITPSFSDIEFNYDTYNSSGVLFSSSFDWQDEDSYLDGLSWNENISSGSVGVSLRTAGTEAGLTSAPFTGISKSACNVSGGVVTCPSSAIPSYVKDGNNDKWIQYRVILNGETSGTPIFSNINISSDQLLEPVIEIENGSHLPSEAYLPPVQPEVEEENKKGEFKIIINNGEEFTRNKEVNVKLFSGNNTTGVAISENPDFTYASIMQYKKELKFTLSPFSSEKTIYAKFYTKYGQTSEIVSATIVYSDVVEDDINKKEDIGIVKYIDPVEVREYIIDTPWKMFKIMGDLSLGVTNSFINNTVEFPDKLLGRILLDVEDLGKAYYINPIDKLKYYLGKPKEAFELLRSFLE